MKFELESMKILEREGLEKYADYVLANESIRQSTITTSTSTTSVSYHPHTVNAGTRICSFCGLPIQKFILNT